MKVVVAPDSFKGSLTAPMVAEAIEHGIHRVFKHAEVVKVPIADGGEGTTECMVRATDGYFVMKKTLDPLGRPVDARFGILADGVTGVVEVAAASGLTLLRDEEKNPLVATSYGTGHLMRIALELGCTTLVIGLGGSATNDGGLGLMQALGARFFDGEGQELGFGGEELEKLARLDLTGLEPRLAGARVVVACDVDNPLTGPRGASAVFGPQKGATPEMVARLDAGLDHFYGVMEAELGIKVRETPGAGAAGGLGACLMAFLGATLEPGAPLVMSSVGLAEKMRDAQLVITGEGRLDGQTVAGKAPVGVARLARAQGKPVLALVGGLEKGYQEVFAQGIWGVMPVVPGPLSLEQAMSRGFELVADTAQRAMMLWRAFALAGAPTDE